MQIFKFGGASVKNADGVRNLANIVKSFDGNSLVVVVSAMGKTTNKLEDLVDLARSKSPFDAVLEELTNYHRSIANDLLNEVPETYLSFEKSLEEKLEGLSEYDDMFAYDMIVPHGELMSTSLIAAYLSQEKVDCNWVDARTLIRTDQYFSEANVDWVVTEKQINQLVRDKNE